MRVALAVVLVLLGGCSYYNGMYRVDHLAGQARSAEREGRTFTATSLWGQGATTCASQAPRIQCGTFTGSVRTFWKPSALSFSTAHATARASPAEPAGRGPT